MLVTTLLTITPSPNYKAKKSILGTFDPTVIFILDPLCVEILVLPPLPTIRTG